MNESHNSPVHAGFASDTAIHISPQFAMFSVFIAYGIASAGWGAPYGAVAALVLILCVGLYWWFNLRPFALILNISLAFSGYTMLIPMLICFVFYSRSAALLGLAGALGAWLMNRIQMAMYTGAWQTVVETRSPIKRAFRLLWLALTHFGVIGAFAVTAIVCGVRAGFQEFHDARIAASMSESMPTVKNPVDAWRAGSAMIGPNGTVSKPSDAPSPHSTGKTSKNNNTSSL